MIKPILVAACLSVIALDTAYGQTVPLSFTANGQTNYVEYFSDAIVRINNLPNVSSLSSSSDPNMPRTTTTNLNYNQNGNNLYPHNVNFVLGNLNYDNAIPITGVGLEIRTVTGLNLNIAQDMPRFNPTTTTTDVVGTVSFTNGILSSIDVTADLRLTYPTTSGFFSFLSGQSLFEDNGLQISGSQINFFVDDEFPSSNPQFPWRTRYDAFGVSTAVGNFTPIPEPVGLLACVGLAYFGLLRRVR